MIRTRFLGLMTLAACRAARRFALVRGNSSEGRNGWLAVVLRWRQQRKRSEIWRVQPAVEKVTRCFPQFHLHFSTPQIERKQRQTVVHFRPTDFTSRTATLSLSRETRTHAITFWSPMRSQSFERRIPAHDASVQRMHRGATPEAKRSRIPMLVQSPFSFLRSGRSPMAEAFALSHSTRETSIETRHLRTQALYWLAPPRGAARSERRPASSASSLSRVNRTAPLRLESAEELVWRRDTRPSSPEQHGASSSFPETSSRTGPRSFSGQRSSPESVAAVPQPNAQQITKLDPALVDRLTDDVIRRVERRVRIERERRGL